MHLSLSLSDGVEVPWLEESNLEKLGTIAGTLNPEDAEVCVVIVDDPYIQRVNLRYREIDKPTDVISFSYLESGLVVDNDQLAGEIYISHETLEKEAKELGVNLSHLFLRIGVHGLLHIIGRDHETDAEADSMEEEERKMLENYLEPEALAALF